VNSPSESPVDDAPIVNSSPESSIVGASIGNSASLSSIVGASTGNNALELPTVTRRPANKVQLFAAVLATTAKTGRFLPIGAAGQGIPAGHEGTPGTARQVAIPFRQQLNPITKNKYGFQCHSHTRK
jgi:hypothetical protein